MHYVKQGFPLVNVIFYAIKIMVSLFRSCILLFINHKIRTMKKYVSPFKLALLLPAAALLFILSSFSFKPGGEGFEVFQNNKLMFQQFGNNMQNIKSLQLNAAGIKDQITIKYYHCGRIGKNRHLIIRGTDNKELKNWQFANSSEKDPGMSFRVGDVLSLQPKGKRSALNVYYSSTEIPEGRLLVSLVVNS
ncbi:MAG: hypothetical protein BGO52_18415 [Sphingobacteriales bacterium 44-61]|nr:MAG: hypothetical protein BGO52_18415 [Sphingobacteriales bacterium 44-61]